MDLSIGLQGPPERVVVKDVLTSLRVNASPEDATFLQRAADHHDEISDWLGSNPEAMERFKTAPLTVLARQFPELEPPKRRLAPIPDSVADQVRFRQFEPPTPAAELLARVTTWVAAAQANADQFSVDPFAVLASQSAGYPAVVVEQVRAAISTALGMPTIEHVLNVADAVRIGRP